MTGFYQLSYPSLQSSQNADSHLFFKVTDWFLKCIWECKVYRIAFFFLKRRSIMEKAMTFFFKIYFIDYAITVVPFFPPLYSPLPCTSPPSFPHLTSCPWVIHISSLASPFPILFNYFFLSITKLWLTPTDVKTCKMAA